MAADLNAEPEAIHVEYGRRNEISTDVLIVGAGLSGMMVAIDMIRKRLGRNFIIVEKGTQIGGTWNDQRYPGCCCDIWSHLYSLSFEPNPNWTRLYPTQPEIHAYLLRIASKYSLYPNIRFSSSAVSTAWDSNSCTWTTTIQRLNLKDAEYGAEYSINSNFLVSAVGQLNTPRYPTDIPGLDSFSGKMMHSARWDWSYDLRSKKIGILGNGASAVQIIPEVAKVAEELVVFQRTPNWVVPRGDTPISGFWQWVYRWVPGVRKRLRAGMMDDREETFQAVFDPESAVSQGLVEISMRHLEEQLPGGERKQLRQKLTPGYSIGCKRVIISDDFFPTFRRPNVNLVTDRIESIDPTSVLTSSGSGTKTERYELDVLILATGFITTQFLHSINIHGSGSKSLSEVWTKDGAAAYLGMTVPSLPNFAMLYGPNTNLGHNSIILMIEAQSLYITTLISKVLTAKSRGKTLALEPRDEVVKKHNEEMQERLKKSAWADERGGSWYKDEKGRVTNNWSDTVVKYQEATSRIDWDEWVFGGTGAEEVRREGKVKWKRVVEETRVSNLVLGSGVVVAVVGAMVGGLLWRGRLRSR